MDGNNFRFGWISQKQQNHRFEQASCGSDQMPLNHRPLGHKPLAQTSSNQTPSDQANLNQADLNQANLDKTPFHKTSFDKLLRGRWPSFPFDTARIDTVRKSAAQVLTAIGSAISLTTFSLAGLGNFGLAVGPAGATAAPKQAETTCPKPALSRLVRHRVAAGETLESIAQQYNLLPTTLIGMNSSLQQGSLTIGSEILVPPYNGIRVTVPAGSSWRDIAEQYNVRADLLFEQNGCQEAPTVVFIPGVNWSPAPSPTSSQADRSPITRLPLPEATAILLAYGWQVNPTTNAVQFHSGVNIEAPAGTSVLAAGAGTVAFAGEQQGYGNLVVINHSQGLQTRYGNLSTITVRAGQQVQAGSQLGTVAGTENRASYLHFQVRANSRLGWVAQDPGAYFRELAVGRR
jgi:murein DD-endopeptidase MepM/ murein hydrolase activator NlpD